MDQMDPVDAHEVGELVKERRTRNYKRLAGVLFGVALLGGVGFVVMQRLDKGANQKVDAAFSRLNRCLIGAPLADKEIASVRLRRVQLTALTLPDQKRVDNGGAPWPQRCGAFAHAVSETLHDAGRAESDKKDLAGVSESFAKLLTDPNANPLTRDYGAAIDALYESALGEKVAAETSSDAPAPPGDAAAPFTLDTLAPVAPLSKRVFNLQSVMAESHASREIHLLIEDKTDEKAPWSLCTIEATKIRCKKLPESIQASKSGLRLLGTTADGAAPLVFAGNRGTDGVFRSDTGELVDKLYSYGGYTDKDGFAAVLGWDDDKKEPRLVRQKTGGKADGEDFKTDLRVGNAFYGTALLWNQLVIRGVVKKKEERRLVAQPIDKGEKAGDGLKSIGGLPEAGLIERGEEDPHISGCKSAEATVARVKGYSNEFVAFKIGDAWREPIGSEAQGGFITCRKAEATITRIDSYGLTQNRCSTSGCKSSRVALDKLMPTQGELAPRTGYLQAIDVDGQVLVVWAAGEKGGVRYRLAPIERIAQAPDVVLYDDLVEGYKVGNLSTLFGIGLVAREGYAIVVLATKGGIVALRATPDGKITAAPAEQG